MKKLLIGVLLVSVTCSSVWAGKAANKVTGDFGRDNGSRYWICEISAHQMNDDGKKERSQKGVFYCEEPATGYWWELNLAPINACVSVKDDVTSRLGGFIATGTDPNGVNKWWGFEIKDNGEPGAGDFPDEVNVVPFASGAEFFAWCESDIVPARDYEYNVVDGNIQVHYYD